MYQELAPVVSNREVMPGIHLLWIESAEIAAAALPGQFVMMGCDSSYGRLLRRPISVHRTSGKRLAFLFAAVGTGTEWLSQKKAGEKVDLLGPMGNGFSIDSKTRNVLLVAGGMGIAPLYLLSEEARKRGLQVKLLTGAKTASLVCPSEILPAAAECTIATEDGSTGEKGLVTSLLQKHIDWADQMFACGPVPMYRTIVKNYGGLAKIKRMQVSLEVRMGCGLGFCYACTIQTRQGLKQACKDGPVFELDDVVWERL